MAVSLPTSTLAREYFGLRRTEGLINKTDVLIDKLLTRAQNIAKIGFSDIVFDPEQKSLVFECKTINMKTVFEFWIFVDGLNTRISVMLSLDPSNPVVLQPFEFLGIMRGYMRVTRQLIYSRHSHREIDYFFLLKNKEYNPWQTT